MKKLGAVVLVAAGALGGWLGGSAGCASAGADGSGGGACACPEPPKLGVDTYEVSFAAPLCIPTAGNLPASVKIPGLTPGEAWRVSVVHLGDFDGTASQVAFDVTPKGEVSVACTTKSARVSVLR